MSMQPMEFLFSVSHGCGGHSCVDGVGLLYGLVSAVGGSGSGHVDAVSCGMGWCWLHVFAAVMCCFVLASGVVAAAMCILW